MTDLPFAIIGAGPSGLAAARTLQRHGLPWQGYELADDVGEDADDLAGVVRAGEWEAPLRIEAEQLVLAALGAMPLLEVESEGLPLSLVRARGYARDNEELELGVRCMAAGIHDDSGKLVAGLSISAPADRLQDDWLDDLVNTAAQISATLGHRPAGPV